ncbi:hypothetical protein [Campylobacter concisus]|uniref:hypothetical protein n=1 Tax=Campylobacter concisus TaxID=199 RepID=UPI000CD8815B|nr:hypothetical protein [Campylobacter concisus]
MCCTKCGYEKVAYFGSDCLDPDDMTQILKVCPKCGNDKFERKPCTDSGYSIFDMIKKILK